MARARTQIDELTAQLVEARADGSKSAKALRDELAAARARIATLEAASKPGSEG